MFFAVAAILCFEVSFALVTAVIHGSSNGRDVFVPLKPFQQHQPSLTPKPAPKTWTASSSSPSSSSSSPSSATFRAQKKQKDSDLVPPPPVDLRNHAVSVAFASCLHFWCPAVLRTNLEKMFLLPTPPCSSFFQDTLSSSCWTTALAQDCLESCFRVCVFLLLADFFFYWIHRSLHRHHRLYLPHVKHHRWTTPVQPEAGLDSSLLEFLINSSVLLLPFALGLRLTEKELIGTMGIVGANIAVTHSSSLGHFGHVRHHLLHHKFHKFNFGATPIFDRLFGTFIDQ